jgi:tight adherence protein C
MPIILFVGALLYYWLLYKGQFEPVRHGLISTIIAAGGYMLPGIFLTNATSKRQTKMQRAFPDALDLMVICVESGMSVEKSFQWVSEEIAAQSQDLAEEIALTCAELSYLGDRSKAYENFSTRTGMQQVKALTGTLIQAERYGTPVGSALRVLSDESRTERMSIAERKAASLPAKLTVPMIVFFLPVLFVVIIGPAYLQFQVG